MSTNPRVAKLADQIKVVVAETLERRIKDPRLGFITVTDVRLTGDSREATIFYTVMGDEQAPRLRWPQPPACCARPSGDDWACGTPRAWPL